MQTTARLANKLYKGFTLIEVLIVIGILGILATVALVAINPAEAQKKARDVQRLKDMATLQTVVEEYLADNPGAGNVLVTGGNKDSSGGTKVCSANWLNVNLCPYLNIVPVDPTNRSGSTTTSTGTVATQNLYYYYRPTAAGYKLCTYLESTSNKAKVDNLQDGGTSVNTFEVFSDQLATCP